MHFGVDLLVGEALQIDGLRAAEGHAGAAALAEPGLTLATVLISLPSRPLISSRSMAWYGQAVSQRKQPTQVE